MSKLFLVPVKPEMVETQLEIGPRVVRHGVLDTHVVQLPRVRGARPLQEPDRLPPRGIREKIVAGDRRAPVD